MSNSKLLQLEQIAEDVVADKVTPQLAQSATQLVMGAGNPDAGVVFIGEAPGKREDELGEPFVGAAGRFLDEMLESIGFKREDVYITNIVKYRPPGNRDPLPEEKAAFWPYLLRQLEVIEPQLIVTLGRHSMEYFLPGQRISQIHGQPKRIKLAKSKKQKAKGRPGSSDADAAQGASSDSGVAGSAGEQSAQSWVVLPLYHPAAALYNGGMRQTLLDDFAKIPKVLKLLGGGGNERINEQEAKQGYTF